MCPAFSFLKKLFRIEPAVKLDHLRDQAGPAGLMVDTEAGAVVSVEILVELKIIAPMRMRLELVRSAVHRTLALRVKKCW